VTFKDRAKVPLVDIQSLPSETDESDSEESLEGVIVWRHLNPHRTHAYIVCAIYCILCTAIVYTITAGWSRAQLASFWKTMISASLVDLLVAEWFYLALKLLYSWMISNTAVLMAEIHPYEGEEVLRGW
jgi:hypothetical protein